MTQPQQPNRQRSSTRLHLLRAIPLVVLSALVSATAIAGAGKPNSAGPGSRGPIDISAVEIELGERFNNIDTDDSETISLAEFKDAATSLERPNNERRRGARAKRRVKRGSEAGDAAEFDRDAWEAALFELMDANDDGVLSEAEASNASRQAARQELLLAQRFERLDTDANGELDRSEFSARIDRLKAADANGDGLVSRDEMRAQWRAKRDAPNGVSGVSGESAAESAG
ncbi:MAG: EF-hand domain-containing protein [Pseudomonadota bacterium]